MKKPRPCRGFSSLDGAGRLLLRRLLALAEQLAALDAAQNAYFAEGYTHAQDGATIHISEFSFEYTAELG